MYCKTKCVPLFFANMSSNTPQTALTILSETYVDDNSDSTPTALVMLSTVTTPAASVNTPVAIPVNPMSLVNLNPPSTTPATPVDSKPPANSKELRAE